MSDKSVPRKIAFNLYPTEELGDKLAADLLDETRLKERGRAMRAFLLTGAALAAIDRRLPFLIAELATENITLQDIQHIISSVIPDAFIPDDAMLRTLLARLGTSAAALDTPGESPVQKMSEEKKAAEATRANSSMLFRDEED